MPDLDSGGRGREVGSWEDGGGGDHGPVLPTPQQDGPFGWPGRCGAYLGQM